MTIRSWIRRLFRRACKVQHQAKRRSHWNPLALERLEDRLAPATLTEIGGGTTLLFTLDVASEQVVFNSNDMTYTIEGSSNFVNGGVTNAGDFTGFGTTLLTMNASALTRYNAVRVEDSAADTAVGFFDSGTNAYSDAFAVALDNASRGVEFRGASSFGGNALDVKTDRVVLVSEGATVSTGNGGITLWGNNQATPTIGENLGIFLGGTVTSTGSGNLDIRGRGGNNPDQPQFGVVVAKGGVVSSTGTGNITVVGTGGTGSGTNAGVAIVDEDSLITSVRGAINITGTAVANTVIGSTGVLVIDGGKVTSTGTGTTAATITITGTGAAGTGGNNGFRLEGADAGVETVDGDISIVATPGTGDRAIELRDSGQIKVTGSADVELRATSGLIFIASSIVAPDATVRLIAEAGDILGSNLLIDSSNGQITAKNVGAYASGSVGLGLRNTVDGTFAARAVNGDVNFTSTVGANRQRIVNV